MVIAVSTEIATCRFGCATAIVATNADTLVLNGLLPKGTHRLLIGLAVLKNGLASGCNLLRGSETLTKWFLPTLSEVLVDAGTEVSFDASPASPTAKDSGSSDKPTGKKSWQQWRCGVMALQHLLLEALPDIRENSGALPVVLCGPVPMFSHPVLVSRLQSWTFTADPLNPGIWLLAHRHRHSLPLLPLPDGESQLPAPQVVPLLLDDPLTKEHFCVCVTANFSLVMVLGAGATGEPAFQFSFDPEVVAQSWRVLRPRALLTAPKQELDMMDRAFERFGPVAPSYKTVMRFTQLLLKYLPDVTESDTEPSSSQRLLPAGAISANSETLCRQTQTVSFSPNQSKRSVNIKTNLSRQKLEEHLEQLAGKGLKAPTQGQDVELLQAIAHEVRTPLTTIRTLTRLLLKRHNLDPDVIKRLETIDRECTEQIDRFSLIFRAVELETSETKRTSVQLTSTSLAQVFNSCIPRWQKQAARRNLSLDVILPQKMPSVVSDPTMLDQVLSGLIDNFTSSQAAGGHIQVQVLLAGNQLKVQLKSEYSNDDESEKACTQPLKSIGQLLMFQPETGNLSLNLDVTKNLFQALGGKLIVRQKPQQGEVLTIFLPLE